MQSVGLDLPLQWEKVSDVTPTYVARTSVGQFRVVRMRRSGVGTWKWMIKGPTGETLQKFINDLDHAKHTTERIVENILEGRA